MVKPAPGKRQEPSAGAPALFFLRFGSVQSVQIGVKPLSCLLEPHPTPLLYSKDCTGENTLLSTMALWCNWLTRRPLKAESPGSSPGNATNLLSIV